MGQRNRFLGKIYRLLLCETVQQYRKYASEVRKINRKLAEFAKAYGFQEYVCTARFSNGEAWYQLASNPRARLKSVVA